MRCIISCLKEAGLKNSDIDMINSHAGSSVPGDASEAKGYEYLFGTSYDKLMSMPVDEIVE